MADNLQSSIVRDFRQTLLWPVQLMTDHHDTGTVHCPWDILKSVPDSPWVEIKDEFLHDSPFLSETRYQEFVTFMPFAQRFLYGEGKHGRESGGYGESPIHIFSRNDIREVSITLQGQAESIRLRVSHIELYFFFDLDVAMLALEVNGTDLPLQQAMEILYRLGRTYPNYWESDGEGGHCAQRIEWLDKHGQVIAASDYEDKARYLAFVKQNHVPCVSLHWSALMHPLVQHYSEQQGALRYREIEYQRMPLMAYLAFDDVSKLSRGDLIRLGLVCQPWHSDTLPFTEHFLQDFEKNNCYDRYWDDSRQDPWSSSRIMCTGQNFVVVGNHHHRVFTNDKTGIKRHYQNQYFLLFLIAHFQKAALLMLSDRMVQAISRLDIQSEVSVKQFRSRIRNATAVFLRFTHRYWFENVSDQAVARDLFALMLKQLDSVGLFEKTRRRIMDMAEYLEGEEIKRQADTVVRLTVVTILGLIGTMTSGLLGMNLIDLTQTSVLEKAAYFTLVFIPVSVLTFYTVIKSRRLSQFLDALSNEGAGLRYKLAKFRSVWMGKLDEQ
jgi:membrane protein YqaA with SNARE-associated domain